MKSALAFSLAALALAGCEPKAAQIATPSVVPPSPLAQSATAANASCDAHVEANWIDQETPLRRYTAEATALGSVCENAVALVVIRAREGSPIYIWSGAVRDIFGLKDATDAASMKTALAEWIDQKNSSLPTTDKLPPWETTDGQPKRAEFPFHPAADLDKGRWDALRKAKLELFCFPQGAESLNCAALRDGEMQDIGLQQFPG
ncbi:MAG: hypothetical protein ABI740_09390 [Alphaproteobacteria bacterium]